MIISARNKLQRKKNLSDSETGSEIVTTLFLIPLFVAILFAIVDVSTYFQTKTQVQNITRDGARTVALLGGTSTTIPLNKDKFGGSGINVTNYVYDKLVDGSGNCRISGCSAPPTVTCSPNIATAISANATCTVNYRYRGVGGALVEWLGFGAITGNVITATETFKVETAW